MLSIFLLASCLSVHLVSCETDTVIQLPALSSIPNLTQCTDVLCKPSEVNLHGHHNYYAAQQIFYLGGREQVTVKSSEETAKNATEPKYRDDYVVTPNVGVHKLHRQKITWNAARLHCIFEGAHLAVINSNKEETVLLNMMSKEKLATAWLGVHDLYEEGTWTTIFDEPLGSTGYAKWTPAIPNDPDNAGGRQNCGILMKQTGMDDIQCDSVHAFFCELPLV